MSTTQTRTGPSANTRGTSTGGTTPAQAAGTPAPAPANNAPAPPQQNPGHPGGGGGGGPPGGGGGGGGGQPPPGGPPQGGAAGGNQAAPFALSPAMATAGQVLDYTTEAGQKLFNRATDSLYEDSTDLFDCQPEQLQDFIDRVKNKCIVHNFAALRQVPDTSTNPPTNRDVLTNHGVLSLEMCVAHANTYVNTQTRLAQDSFILGQCLMNSLSPAGRAKCAVWQEQYMPNGIIAGIPLLRVIIKVSSIDTNATAAYIRAQLSSLDQYMKDADSNILVFNQHVTNLVRQLEARRQRSDDILSNLFKGYKEAEDDEFVAYIKRKEEDYEEGNDPFTYEQLMQQAENKYKIRVQNKTWKAPSKQDEQLLALQAKVKQLESKRQKNPSTPKKDKEKQPKKKDKGKKIEYPAWVYKAPTDGKKSKVVEGKTYYWCKNHNDGKGMWVRHSPDQCRAKPSSNNKSEKDKRKLSFAKSLSAVTTGDDESDEE